MKFCLVDKKISGLIRSCNYPNFLFSLPKIFKLGHERVKESYKVNFIILLFFFIIDFAKIKLHKISEKAVENNLIEILNKSVLKINFSFFL